MSAETTHLFLNPTAGRGRAGRRLARILALFAEASVEVELHLSKSVGDLERRCFEQAKSGATRLVVAGGDGSIHEAVNGFMRANPDAALGVIPTGTGNDFAKAAGIPLAWEHACRLLAERIASGATPRELDVGQCNDRYFANGAGVGFDAKVTQIARSIRWPIGDVVYLVAVFKAMAGGIASPELRVTSDDFNFDGAVTLVNISNGPWVGGLFHIAPMADNGDGTLELLLAEPVTRRRIMRLLPLLMKGTHLGEPEIQHQSIRSVAIRASEPMPSHLDGEVQPMQTEFEISILPGALRLL